MAEHSVRAGAAASPPGLLTKRELIARAAREVDRAERAVARATDRYRAAETLQLQRLALLRASAPRVLEAKARTIERARELTAARDRLDVARQALAAARTCTPRRSRR